VETRQSDTKMIRFCIFFCVVIAVAVAETRTEVTEEVIEEVETEGRRPKSGEKTAPQPVCGDDGVGVFTQAFKHIGGNIVDVSARGKEVWVIKADLSIYRFKNGVWEKIPGGAYQVGTSPDGRTWVIGGSNGIYRYNINAQNWENIPGGLSQINALSHDDAVGTNSNSDSFLWRGGKWNVLPRGADNGLPVGASWISIGLNDERWAVGPNDDIVRLDVQANKWVPQPGAAVSIDVHSPGRIVAVNRANQVLAWVPEKKEWKTLVGKTAKRATISDSILITLGTDGFLSAYRH